MRPDGNKTGSRAQSRVDGALSDERTVWMTPLESRFAKAEPNLNSSRRQLLREILDNCQETYFLSSRELAKRYEVDTATIVRTVQVLGYKRYGDFLVDLRSHFVSRITPYRAMKSATRERRGLADRVNQCLAMESRNLDSLRSSLHADRVIEVAKRIHRARRILVIGVDFAASLARLLAYGLVTLGHDAEAPEGSTGNLQHKVNLLSPKDLLIGISFGRCLRATVDSLVRARNHKVSTFGITNSATSPIARFSDSFWVTSIANPSFHGSYVAPLAAINALLAACAHLHPQRSLALLRDKEQEFRSGTRWYSTTDAAESRSGFEENGHGRTGRVKQNL